METPGRVLGNFQLQMAEMNEWQMRVTQKFVDLDLEMRQLQ